MVAIPWNIRQVTNRTEFVCHLPFQWKKLKWQYRLESLKRLNCGWSESSEIKLMKFTKTFNNKVQDINSKWKLVDYTERERRTKTKVWQTMNKRWTNKQEGFCENIENNRQDIWRDKFVNAFPVCILQNRLKPKQQKEKFPLYLEILNDWIYQRRLKLFTQSEKANTSRTSHVVAFHR